MSNIIEHPVVTAEKVESLWNIAGDELNQGEIHAGLSLEHYAKAGAALASLRDQNPTNIKFGVACAEHEIFLKPQMRSAVIWWGRLSDDQRESLVFVFPGYGNPESLQRGCREWKPEWLKFEKKSGIGLSDTTIENPQPPEIQPNTTPIEPEPMNQPEENCQDVVEIEKSGRTYLVVVSDFYKNASTSTIKKTFGNKMSDMGKIILSGVLGKSSEYRFSSHNVLSIRSFYPDYPNRWRFGNVSGLDLIKSIDAIVEHHKRCGNDLSKENCNAVFNEMENERTTVALVPIKINLPNESGVFRGGNDSPVGIENIIVAGVVIWDKENPMGVEHEEVWYAFHTFKHMIGSVPVEDHADFARGLQGATRYMNGIMLNTAVDAIRRMADAVHKSPEKHVTETSAAHPATRHSKG